MAIALHQLILCVSVLPYRIFPMPIVQIILFFPSFCKAAERCRHIALFSCGQVYLPYCSPPANTFSELTLRLFGVVPPQNGGLPPLFSRLAQSRIFPMPGNKGDYDNLLQGIDSGAVTLEQVKINASRVVKMARALTKE